MEKLSGEILLVLYGLLPGFLAAWIFHAFTQHRPKSEQWARIIQALIFTGIIKVLVLILGGVLLWIGKGMALGVWNDDTALIWSYLLAMLFGIAVAAIVNTDALHALARMVKFSRETSAPSEWCFAFTRHEFYVVLHLKDGQRLYGWPDHWPNECDSGHFSITQPAWFSPDGSTVWPLHQVQRLLIPTADVGIVEMYKTPAQLAEINLTGEQIRAAQSGLAALHQKETNHEPEE